MSTTPPYISRMFANVASTAQESPKSPLPGQEDQSARLAASAEVGQVEGTNSLEQFQRWLETKAHAAFARVDRSSDYPTADELGHLYIIAKCRAATELLMQFKLEQGA